MCYADGVPDLQRRRLLCIREDHTRSDREPQNSIVSIALDNDSGPTCGDILVSGNDFYASPRPSPDGRQLAWLTWNHSNMPWDGTELWIADLEQDGSVRMPRCVAGGTGVSVFQPEWSPDGRLYFVSDQSGWWDDSRSARLTVFHPDSSVERHKNHCPKPGFRRTWDPNRCRAPCSRWRCGALGRNGCDLHECK